MPGLQECDGRLGWEWGIKGKSLFFHVTIVRPKSVSEKPHRIGATTRFAGRISRPETYPLLDDLHGGETESIGCHDIAKLTAGGA
jgi:hypothetical protein